MTNAEAIETLRANYPDACFEQLRCAVDMAINALTKEAWKEEHPVSPLLQKLATNLQPSKQDADDTISRKAAIDAMENVDWYHINSNGQLVHGANSKEDEPLYKAEDVYKVLNDVPSAQPERMRAKWIATTSLQEGQITWKDYKCSNCSHHREKPMNFCEVCGAKMER